ncbi:hypothetical protein [uncultured Leifsonia sp.]|uniref:hypothetical protein n=1 Tax=uncultured Leifsonia sp. TaxID=340359 RepID=UPI0028D09471|nr:hypothetical protein [uncultured Leifsonia sp.]
MAYRATERLVPTTVTRIELEAEVPFDTLCRALEAEVPPLDEDALRRLIAEGADWSRLTRELAGPGIHRLVRFFTEDPTAVMRLGGADIPSAAYLIGDYLTAARMFRHDPGVLLYTPLRLELHAVGPARTILSVDQPSSALTGFGNNKIGQAAYELDRMLGDLLEEIGLPRPSVLRL